jgi:hypothetical protein
VTGAAKSSLDRVKFEFISEGGDIGVVIQGIISVKETDVVLEIRPSDNLCNSLCNVSAGMLAFLLR